MILRDFVCTECGHCFEDLVANGEFATPCPQCTYTAGSVMSAPHVFTEIVPTTKTSKKRKAGYQHSHADRPKTPGKVQVSVP